MRLKETIGISITNNEKTLWSRHAESCNMRLSAWISLMIHIGINKNLDKEFQRREPTPLPKEAVLPAPAPARVTRRRVVANPPIPIRGGFTMEQWRNSGAPEDEIATTFGSDYRPPR